jgi:hypothetical protein
MVACARSLVFPVLSDNRAAGVLENDIAMRIHYASDSRHPIFLSCANCAPPSVLQLDGGWYSTSLELYRRDSSGQEYALTGVR